MKVSQSECLPVVSINVRDTCGDITLKAIAYPYIRAADLIFVVYGSPFSPSLHLNCGYSSSFDNIHI